MAGAHCTKVALDLQRNAGQEVPAPECVEKTPVLVAHAVQLVAFALPAQQAVQFKQLCVQAEQHVDRRRERWRWECRSTSRKFKRTEDGQDSLNGSLAHFRVTMADKIRFLGCIATRGRKNATVRCLRVAVSLVDPRSCTAFTQEVALRGSARHERIWQTWEW